MRAHASTTPWASWGAPPFARSVPETVIAGGCSTSGFSVEALPPKQTPTLSQV